MLSKCVFLFGLKVNLFYLGVCATKLEILDSEVTELIKGLVLIDNDENLSLLLGKLAFGIIK